MALASRVTQHGGDDAGCASDLQAPAQAVTMHGPEAKGSADPAWSADARLGLANVTASAYLRLFGAASIIWFHVAPQGVLSSVGGIGLGVFLLLSFMGTGRDRGFGPTAKRRAIRLLVPWAGWWLVYAALAAWMARGVPPVLLAPATIWQVLAWPAIHLWYLPFAFVAGLIVFALRSRGTSMTLHAKAALAIAAGLALLLIFGNAKDLPSPLAQALLASPTLPLGIAYGYCMRMPERRQRTGWFAAIAILVTAASVPVWLEGDEIVAVAYAGSTIMMILCMLRLPRSRQLVRLSALTLGIYLAHPLAMLVLMKFLGSNQAPLVLALETLALTTLMVIAMRQVPYLRAIV